MRHLTSTEGSSSPCGSSEDHLGRSSGADSAYLSARALSDDDGHIYEEMEMPAPPKIAPVSGVLSNKDKSLLRPIAFKPVVIGSNSLPSSTPSPSSWERISPSPPGDLDSVLREKEAEITYLRQTLEHNEQVIFKVYEEKEQSWVRELHAMQKQYESKLIAIHQSHEQESSQVKREKEQLEEEMEKLRKEYTRKDNRMKQIEEELTSCRSQLEETEWKMCHKSGEISLLKAQLRDCQGTNASRVAELASVKSKLKDCQQLLLERDQRIADLERRLAGHRQDSGGDNRLTWEKRSTEPKSRYSFVHCEEQRPKEHQLSEVEWLRIELSALQQKLKSTQESIQDERSKWELEKERVICYQKKTAAQLCTDATEESLP